nr:MAG TPA: hypothetical protein [Caudoviricetes sp.]
MVRRGRRPRSGVQPAERGLLVPGVRGHLLRHPPHLRGAVGPRRPPGDQRLLDRQYAPGHGVARLQRGQLVG